MWKTHLAHFHYLISKRNKEENQEENIQRTYIALFISFSIGERNNAKRLEKKYAHVFLLSMEIRKIMYYIYSPK